MPIYKKVNIDFFKKWSPEMSYTLGFIFADGNIIKTKRDTWFLSIQITDKYILDKIKNILDSDHKISKRPSIKNNKNLYRLQIGSKEMCTDLILLGVIQKKSKTIRIPNIPIKYQPDFIRGYFDGDGHVWVGKNNKKYTTIITGFTSGSIDFLNDLKDLLRKYKLFGGSIVNKERGFCLQYSVKDSFQLSKIMYNSSTQRNSLFLKRKKLIFDKFNKRSRSSTG